MKSFLWLLVGALLVTFRPASAEETKRIVILESMSLPMVQQGTDWMLAQLAEFGFIPGETIDIQRLNAERDSELGAKLILEVLEADPDIDLVISNATLAAKAAKQAIGERDIPHMFFFVTDPVRAGLIEELGAPSPGITGRSHAVSAEVRLGMISELLQGQSQPVRIGVLVSEYTASLSDFRSLQAVAASYPQLSLTKIDVPFLPSTSFPELAQMAADRWQGRLDNIDFLWMTTGPLAQSPEYVERVSELLRRPIVYANSQNAVRKGAMMAFFADAHTVGTDAGLIVARLLSGEAPGTISSDRVDRFAVSLNMPTAKELGVVFPSHLLELAGDNLIW